MPEQKANNIGKIINENNPVCIKVFSFMAGGGGTVRICVSRHIFVELATA